MKNNAIRMVVKFILHSSFFILHFSFFILHFSFFIYFHACRDGKSDEAECHDEKEEVLIADAFGNKS